VRKPVWPAMKAATDTNALVPANQGAIIGLQDASIT